MLMQIFLLLLSMAFGAAVSCGFIAFIVIIGVISKLTAKTHTFPYILLYEDMTILGITLGNICFLYHVPLPFSYFGMLFFSLFCGIFTGCLAGALAEVINVFPILSRRLKLRVGLPYIAGAVAFGKGLGVIFQWFIM